MNKKLKSSTDNQWISTPEDVLKNKNSKHNNKKQKQTTNGLALLKILYTIKNRYSKAPQIISCGALKL